MSSQATIRPAVPPAAASLRVLMVTARYFPYMGGTETHVYEVARRLADAGTHVSVCTTDVSGKLPAEEYQQGVHIGRVPAWPARRDYYLAPAIVDIIRHGKWDLIHCQGYHTLVAPMAMLAASRARIPYIVSFHSGGHSSPLRNAVRRPQHAALRPLLARATRLVAVSEFEAAFFRERLRLPPERFVVIPNGAQLPPVGSPSERGETLILSVGRLERYKGHHRVLAAFPRVLAHCPDARLHILGSGPYEDTLRRMARDLGIADRVEIGPIPPDNRQGMADVLAEAALVVLLSDYEAHPVAVMEALAAGRSVLATRSSGLQELAEHGLIRAIAPSSSDDDVATAMLEQLRRPHVPPRVELPTWEACADRLLALYGDVTDAARRGKEETCRALS